MRTKIIVALLLAVMLVCSVSALAEAGQMIYEGDLWYSFLYTNHVDPYNSDGAAQFAQHLINTGSTPEAVELGRYQGAMAINEVFHTNYAPQTIPQLGDDSIPLSLLAGLAALALGGAVFAHRRCKQC